MGRKKKVRSGQRSQKQQVDWLHKLYVYIIKIPGVVGTVCVVGTVVKIGWEF
jgi:hypothetical protein